MTSVSTSSFAPAGSASRSRRSASAATASASWPGATRIVTPADALGHERRVPEPRLPAEDAGHVDGRLDERPHVELLGRVLVERHRADAVEFLGAGRQLAPAGELVRVRLHDAGAERLGQAAVVREEGDERLAERVDRVERGTAVVARVEVAVAGADVEVERHEAARRDHELRRVPALHPAVEDHARVDRSLVGREKPRDRVAARLLLAVAHHPEGHGQRALACQRRDRLELHPELPLVIGDAPRVEPLAAHLGRERIALPELERVRRLDVVVPVHEHRRGPRRAGNLADVEPSVLLHLRLAAERANPVADPVGGAPDVGRVRGIGAHARDREEVAELVEPAGTQRFRSGRHWPAA